MSTLMIFIAAAIVAAVSAETGYEASLRLWDNAQTSLTLSTTEYTPDFRKYNFGAKTQRIEVKGTWLLFQNMGYNTLGDGAVQCVSSPLTSTISLTSSRDLFYAAKFVGSASDIRLNAITFYNKYSFQGEEEKVTVDTANLKFGCESKSAIITGTSNEGWTVYEGPNFAGNAYCIVPSTSPAGHAAFLLNVKYTVGIPYGLCFASIRKGCHSSKNFVAPRSGGGIVFPSWDS